MKLTLVALFLGLLAQGRCFAVELSCASPAVAKGELQLPQELTLRGPAGAGTFVVAEEKGSDVVLVRRDGENASAWDAAPTGWAFQPIEWLDGSTSTKLELRGGTPGAALVDLHVYCGVEAEQLARRGLRRLVQAELLEARWDDKTRPQQVRDNALAEALQVLTSAPWPEGPASSSWIAAQAQHMEGFLLARQGKASASIAAYRRAATAWIRADDPHRAGIAEFRAAQQVRRQGDLNSAIKSFEHVLAVARAAKDAALEGWVRNDMCLAQRLDLRIEQARQCFEDVIALHRASGNRTEEALSLANLADLEVVAGRYGPARAAGESALERLAGSRELRPAVVAHIVLGNVFDYQGRYAEALEHYREAEQQAHSLGDPNLRANALNQLGVIWLRLGEPERARRFLDESMQIYRQGEYWGRVISVALGLAWVARIEGDAARAETELRSALALAKEKGVAEGELIAQAALAETCVERGDAACAMALLRQVSTDTSRETPYRIRQAIELLRAQLLPQPHERVRRYRRIEAEATEHGDHLAAAYSARLGADQDRSDGRMAAAAAGYTRALALLRRFAEQPLDPLHAELLAVQSRVDLGRFLEVSKRAHGDGEAAERVRLAQVESTRRNWLLARRPRTDSVNLAGVDASAAMLDAALWALSRPDSKPDSRTAGKLEDARIRFEEELMKRSLAGGGSPAKREVSGHRGMESVDDRTLVFFVSEDGTYVWDASRSGLRAGVGAGAAGIRELTSASLRLLGDARSSTADIESHLDALIAALGLADLIHADRGAVTHLVSDGPLDGFPMELLLERARGRTTPDSPMPVRLAGSASTPRVPSPLPCCAHRPLRIFADPAPGAAASAAMAGGMQRLPGAREEALELQKRWPSAPVSIFVGPDFTRARLLDSLSESGALIHVATHGFSGSSSPYLDVLLTSDEKNGLAVLGWHDLLARPTSAALVVLSACEAAGGTGLQKAGTLGLASALLDSGVENVLAPLWAVDDVASISFMGALYTELSSGIALPEALGSARIHMGRDPQTAHPYYWAGYVLLSADSDRARPPESAPRIQPARQQ